MYHVNLFVESVFHSELIFGLQLDKSHRSMHFYFTKLSPYTQKAFQTGLLTQYFLHVPLPSTIHTAKQCTAFKWS